MNRSALQILILLVATAGLGAGCAPSAEGPRQFTVAPGQYAAAFDATREALRELHFDLDRVDAASGVITTRPHFSPGLFEPWDPTQTGLSQEWEDTVNMQAREVRVTFSPARAEVAGSAEADAEADLRATSDELTGSVWVTLLRQHRAGRRLDSEWVGGSSFSIDPELRSRAGLRYRVPLKRDQRLEARLADAIRERLGSGQASEASHAADQQSQ